MRLSWLSLALASVIAWTTGGAPVHAEEIGAPEPSVTAPEPDVSVEKLPARQAVREGNRQLRGGNPAAALEAYARAKELRPLAPQIPFVEGLAQYALQEYDAARDAFKNAATGRNRKLADDALYSVGTTYHAEALASLQNPQQAIGKLENAMQRYREVLANQPDHEAARDSNFKAAAMRRQLIQMLEQQQQQQEQNESCDNPSEDQNEQDKQEQQQQQREEQDQEEQSASQQGDEEQEQQEESPPQPQASDEEQDEEEQLQEQQESAEEQEERVSREQAERRLREMVQAMREREKQRRQRVQQIPVAPVEKDW